MARIKMTGEEYAAKQAARLKASLEDMRTGVERVETAPGKAAAANVKKWVARLAEKSTQDKWAANTGAVTLDQWKADMLGKGIDRVPAGIDAAHDKVVIFGDKLLAYQNAGLSAIDAMPDITLEDSIAKSMAWIRYMAKFEK